MDIIKFEKRVFEIEVGRFVNVYTHYSRWNHPRVSHQPRFYRNRG
jgi:hypothetical protein